MNKLVPIAPPEAIHPVAPAESNLIDIGQIWWNIVRFRWLICAIFILCLAAAAGLYKLSEPQYRASALMVLERRIQQVLPDPRDVRPLTTDSPSVDTAVEILQSPSIAGRVVDALDLVNNPVFNPAAKSGSVSSIEQSQEARARAISALRRMLTVRREGVSFAISVRTEAHDAELASSIANEVLEQYVLSRVDGRSGLTKRNADLLAPRLEQLREEVVKAEAAVADYRARNRLFTGSDGVSLTQDELSGLRTKLADAEAGLAASEAKFAAAEQQLSQTQSSDGIKDVLSSRLIVALRTDLAATSRRVAELSSRYGPQHPVLVQAKDELADTEAQIEAEKERILVNLATEVFAATQRRDSLSDSIELLVGRLAGDGSASLRLGELERNAEAARTLYSRFLSTYQDALWRQGTEVSGVTDISWAPVPGRPFAPSMAYFAAAGLLIAATLSVLLVALIQLLRPGISTADELETKLGVRSLASIPEIRSVPGVRFRSRKELFPDRFIVRHPHSVFAEAFRTIRATLHYSAERRAALQVVAVTSAMPNEGKTSSAICLARSAASAGLKTILIDCDARRRASSRMAGETAEYSLQDVLTGAIEASQAIVPDEESGAYVLPQVSSWDVPFDIFGSKAMEDLLSQLRGKFDLVVLDTAPVLPVAETRLLCSFVDAVVYLVRWRATPAKASELGLRQLQEVQAPVVGAVLSRVNVAEQARSGFGDSGLYFKQFKAYYR